VDEETIVYVLNPRRRGGRVRHRQGLREKHLSSSFKYGGLALGYIVYYALVNQGGTEYILVKKTREELGGVKVTPPPKLTRLGGRVFRRILMV